MSRFRTLLTSKTAQDVTLRHTAMYAQAQEVSDEAKESDQESMVEVASVLHQRALGAYMRLSRGGKKQNDT